MTYHGGHHSGPLFFSAFIIRHFQGARQARLILKTSSTAPRSPFSLTGDGLSAHINGMI